MGRMPLQYSMYYPRAREEWERFRRERTEQEEDVVSGLPMAAAAAKLQVTRGCMVQAWCWQRITDYLLVKGICGTGAWMIPPQRHADQDRLVRFWSGAQQSWRGGGVESWGWEPAGSVIVGIPPLPTLNQEHPKLNRILTRHEISRYLLLNQTMSPK